MSAVFIPLAENQTNKHADRCPQSRDKDVKVKEQKRLLVSQPDTVVHPRAMVVHFHDAMPTHATVMGTRGLDGFACFTDAFVLEAHFTLLLGAKQEVDVDRLAVRTLSRICRIWKLRVRIVRN